ncbi:MAG: Gfo/Idh/MocA family oxidoreductase [Verrucomicrobia bacterium]|nr:Gfo/Idh/MocA family oxidoreductase [Verrucomicrobiota bacterium]
MHAKSSSQPAATRRTFLRQSLWAGGAILAPMIVPARVLGRGGGVAPSNRIALGGIGIGPRGKQVLASMMAEKDVQYLATCDVQARMRAEIKGLTDEHYGNRDCATYRDFRELLARPDLDAVLIATGDRWHALGSILAAKAGKDVYSEKPCGITIGLCQAVDDTMRRTARVFQAGTQRRNVPNFEFAAHLARSGRLGRLHTLHASIYKLECNYSWLPAEPEPPKEEIDWDMWLGPAPWRPFNRAYVVDRRWRGYYDFDSGAKLLDWGAHTVDICQWANGADDTVPVEYEPDGGRVYAKYANGVNLVLRPDGWIGQPPAAAGAANFAVGSTGTCPVRFEGDEGWVETGDNGTVELHPASLRQEWRAFTMRGTDPAKHTREFLDCVKSRGRPAANGNVMRHSHIACHAAAIAWMLGRKVRFDPAREAFIDDAEANRMRSRALREPWQV